jgi:hypothetical protein
MKKTTTGALLTALLATTGCQSYLRPFDDRPLPARAVLTRGGQSLEANGSELTLGPGPADIGLALGVELDEDDKGVIVGRKLSKESLLEPDDRIVYVVALDLMTGEPPKPTQPIESMSLDQLKARCDELSKWGERKMHAIDALLEEIEKRGGKPLEGPTPAEVRARENGHEVHAVADLQRYMCGLGWVGLELVVDHRGAERVVRVPLVETKQPVPFVTSDPTGSDARIAVAFRGVTLARLADWPRDRWPLHARSAEDLLVVRVDQGSPAARFGLRPLDVISSPEADFSKKVLAEGVVTITENKLLIPVRSPDGRERTLELRPFHDNPTDYWFPCLVSWQQDNDDAGEAGRLHFALGPFDALLHYSKSYAYAPDSDEYVLSSRFSFLTFFQHESTSCSSGRSAETRFDGILDYPRWKYFLDWADPAK